MQTPIASHGRRSGAAGARLASGAAAVLILVAACRDGAGDPASGGGAPGVAGVGEALVAADIRKVLDEQATAWNAGDLDGFLTGFWDSPELVFTSGGQVLRGRATLRQRYRQGYWSGGDPGKLSFADVEIHALAPDAAWALGRWELAFPTDSVGGVFSLVFRRFDDGWKVVHDHTSVVARAPAEAAPEDTLP
jgi:uncharacterized protein (TIGR02246 family)